MLEDMIGLLFNSQTMTRRLTWQEERTVAAFKELLGEVMREKHFQLQFGIEEKRKDVARLQESIDMAKFAKAFDDEIRHPRC